VLSASNLTFSHDRAPLVVNINFNDDATYFTTRSNNVYVCFNSTMHFVTAQPTNVAYTENDMYFTNRTGTYALFSHHNVSETQLNPKELRALDNKLQTATSLRSYKTAKTYTIFTQGQKPRLLTSNEHLNKLMIATLQTYITGQNAHGQLGIVSTSYPTELTENALNLIKYSRVKCSPNACGYLDSTTNGKLYLTGLNTDYGDLTSKVEFTPTSLDSTTAYGQEVSSLPAGVIEPILDFGLSNGAFIAHAQETTSGGS
jgi:hypothetical protein